MKLTPTIIIDTREQRPYAFKLPSEKGTLDTGDYSVKLLTHLIAAERKELSELPGCIGTHRERFKRELQRLRAYRFRLLIIECHYSDLEAGNWRGTRKPNHVLGALAAWSVQYGINIWLGGTHDECGRFLERWLFQAARCVVTEAAAVNAMNEPTTKAG